MLLLRVFLLQFVYISLKFWETVLCAWQAGGDARKLLANHICLWPGSLPVELVEDLPITCKAHLLKLLFLCSLNCWVFAKCSWGKHRTRLASHISATTEGRCLCWGSGSCCAELGTSAFSGDPVLSCVSPSVLLRKCRLIFAWIPLQNRRLGWNFWC